MILNDRFPEDIFVLPIGDRRLIQSPLQQISALVNKRAAAELEQCAAGKIPIDSLHDSLKDIADALLEVQTEAPGKRTEALNPLFLSFVPTRACNMACGYCDFGSRGASWQKMEYSLAVAAVDSMAEKLKSLGHSKLEIHFFGGEPLVAADLIDVVVHRARAIAPDYGLSTHFEISTNGVCDEKRARFLGDYFDAVVLSLDGFRETHDLHRPLPGDRGSFDQVIRTAELLKYGTAELCLRCCISKHNVGKMREIAEWFCRDFQPAAINFETVLENPETGISGLHPPDPYEFARNFISARRAVAQYGIQFEYASAQTNVVRHTLCPVGQDALIISPDGRVSSCYLPGKEVEAQGLNMDVGHVTIDAGLEIDINAIERIRGFVYNKTICRNCFCRWSCAGGCHVKNAAPDSGLPDSDFCHQTRIITACLLLEEMGQEEQVDLLLQDKDALDVLAVYPSRSLTGAGS